MRCEQLGRLQQQLEASQRYSKELETHLERAGLSIGPEALGGMTASRFGRSWSRSETGTNTPGTSTPNSLPNGSHSKPHMQNSSLSQEGVTTSRDNSLAAHHGQGLYI